MTTLCDDCGEELWGHAERWGLCSFCARKRRECDVCGDGDCKENHESAQSESPAGSST